MSIREKEPPGNGKYLAGGDLLHNRGEGAPPEMGIEVDDLPNRATSEDNGEPDGGGENWLQRSRDAYEFSTSYIDSNYRKKWEDGIRAFNNQHPMDSKYSSPNYSKRSNIFRPKTRSIIRKNEAAASNAFFSNPDAITTEAHNQADPAQRASAEVMKQLIQYRVEKTMPWYLTVIGGVQDAQTIGVVISHQYWDYQERNGEVLKDTPCCDLVAAENLRIDPGSDWRDPIESSPYVIELIPMYIGDLKAKMKKKNPKTGEPEWKEYGEGVIKTAMESKTDSTRITRNKDRGDPYDPTSQAVSDYEIVWVQRHIHRVEGEDWTWYTLADVCMLTEAVRLKEVVHHGKRPYVMGCAIIETHKVYPSGMPEMSSGLQRETNEIANARLDNIYFVLNKKWLVKRGQNTDLPSLVRNVPGGITLTNNPVDDIHEINWPDVTASAYQEQDRLNADFADLTGDFSANQAQLARKGQEPGKIMALQAQAGTPLTEYLLRTIVVTWMDKVLRQLVMLEQEYETDQTVLAIAGQKAKIQKFGIDRVTDEMLKAEMTIRVNVGMGATDPFQKLQKLLMGVGQFKEIATQAPPGLQLQEVAKEIFGLLGYQDGARFFGDQDPEKMMLKQQLQKAGQIIQELGKRHEDKDKEHQTKAQIAHEGNLTSIVTAAMSKDPHIARVALENFGPGLGLRIPPNLPPVDDGKPKEDPAKEQQAQQAQRQEAEAGRRHELIKTKYEGDVKMKLEREKAALQKELKEKELQHQKDLAEKTSSLEKEKMEMPIRIEKEKKQIEVDGEKSKTEPLKKSMDKIAELLEKSIKTNEKLIEEVRKPVVKEADIIKDSKGNYHLKVKEKTDVSPA